MPIIYPSYQVDDEDGENGYERENLLADQSVPFPTKVAIHEFEDFTVGRADDGTTALDKKKEQKNVN